MNSFSMSSHPKAYLFLHEPERAYDGSKIYNGNFTNLRVLHRLLVQDHTTSRVTILIEKIEIAENVTMRYDLYRDEGWQYNRPLNLLDKTLSKTVQFTENTRLLRMVIWHKNETNRLILYGNIQPAKPTRRICIQKHAN